MKCKQYGTKNTTKRIAADVLTCNNAIIWLLSDSTIKLYNITVTELTEYFSLLT